MEIVLFTLVRWDGVISPGKLVLVCSYENMFGQVRDWGTLEHCLNLPVAKWFSFSLIGFGVLFGISILINPCSLFLYFSCVGKLCFLDKVIHDMHISPFVNNELRSSVGSNIHFHYFSNRSKRPSFW
jgi:hypothetical protein